MNSTLETINKSAFLYQQSIMNQFENLCQPLFQLGIKYFDYFKIFNNGKYLRIINNLEYSKVYLSSINDNGLFFTNQINSAQLNKSYYFLLDNINSFEKKKDPIMHLMHDFNMWNAFYIYKIKNTNFLESYAFKMTRQEIQVTQFYLNNLHLLEHFCEYFNHQAKDIIDCADKSKLAHFIQKFDFYNRSKEELFAHKVEQFLQQTCIKKRNSRVKEENISFSKKEIEGLRYLALGKNIKEISNTLELSPFFIERSLRNFDNKNDSSKEIPLKIDPTQLPLSSRQKECLFLLTRGKTAKHIARILGIDHRTVETHIIHIKDKLRCNTREQLIEKAFESGFAYFIPKSLITEDDFITMNT